MADCGSCARPAPDAVLCTSCVDELRTELRSVGWLVDELTVTLTRQSRVGARNGPRGSETPLAFSWAASVDLEALCDGLAMWCTAVAERRGIAVDADRDAAALAGWLLRWVGEAAQHPDAAELAGDVAALTKAARKTIDLPAQLHFIGPCDTCEADLYVSPHAKVATCRTEGCEASYEVEARRIWLLEAAVDQLRTAAELSRELPWIGGVTIDRKLINQWSSRGKLTVYLPHPKDARQSPRFRVGEVIELARRSVESVARAS